MPRRVPPPVRADAPPTRGHARPRAVKPQPGALPATRRDRAAGKGRSARAAAFEQALLWALAIGRRGLALGLALAVVVAFAAGTVEQRWKEGGLRAQVAAQEAELRAAEERNARLRAGLAETDPDAYRAWVEATARRQLSLGYPGETVFLVNWTNPPPGASAAPAPSPVAAALPPAPTPEANWRKWWRLVAGE